MKGDKKAFKKSVSFPKDMLDWLNSRKEIEGVPVSRTVQDAVELYKAQQERGKGNISQFKSSSTAHASNATHSDVKPKKRKASSG